MNRLAITVIVTLTVLGVTLGFLMPAIGRDAVTAPERTPPPKNEQAADLGITFLPLTPGLADYYNLMVKSGALVTEVAPGSLADRGGLRIGDVIQSYNGATIENGNALLGAIRNCPVGNNVVIEISRGKASQTISFVHVR